MGETSDRRSRARDVSTIVNKDLIAEKLAALTAEIAEADVIVAAWRERFPNNSYAWPGAPNEFAVEAMRAMKRAGWSKP